MFTFLVLRAVTLSGLPTTEYKTGGAALPSTLPLANFSTVPIASWCGNASGPLSAASAEAFAARPFVVRARVDAGCCRCR